MTHLNPGGAEMAPHPPMLSRVGPPAHLDSDRLRAGIAERRQRLLDLEAAMVAACEADAARGRPTASRMDDRTTWDRVTWGRYLAAALRLESEYGPPMRRLLREIDQLQRVLALPVGMAAT